MSETKLKDESAAALEALNAAAPEPKPVGNTVAGMPEAKFRAIWISMLSGAMREQVVHGLAEVSKRAVSDRAAGRNAVADEMDAFVAATEEYMRLMENTLRAARQSIKALEGR